MGIAQMAVGVRGFSQSWIKVVACEKTIIFRKFLFGVCVGIFGIRPPSETVIGRRFVEENPRMVNRQAR